MAITASGLYVVTIMDSFDTTQLNIDLDLETHKRALYPNTITPNFSTDTAYNVGPYILANECSGTGYVAGGQVITATALTESPVGTIMYDAADMAWAGSTIPNVRALLAYLDALAGNNALALFNFGSDYNTSGSTLAVQWALGGLFAWDITPP